MEPTDLGTRLELGLARKQTMNADHNPAQTCSLTHQRQAWQARVRARFCRHKNQLTRRWWLPLLAVLAGAAVQAGLWRFETPLYVSSGRLIVNLKLSIPEGSLYTEELNNFLGTQAALMQSAMVVERAHQRAGDTLGELNPQPVALKALILPRTTIFALQGTGPDRRYTRQFVQACMEEYINLKKEMRAQTSDSTLAGMTEEVVRLERELRQGDQDLVAFQSSNSVVLLQEQGNSAGNFLAGLNQRLASLKSEWALLQSLTPEQSLERDQPAAQEPSPPLDQPYASGQLQSVGLSDSGYLRVRQQLLLLRAEHDELAQYLRPKHPKMLALNEEIAGRTRLLAIFRQQSAELLESRGDSLRREMTNLEAQVQEWDGRVLEISRKSAEFARLKADGQRTQALYDRLLATMQTLDVNKQISPESVTIMENASEAVTDRPGLPRKLLLGAAAGFAASVLLLMLLDRLDDRVGSFSELQDLFDEPVLAQIPRERSALRKGEPGLLQPQDARYAFVEAYRSLRSSLLYMADPPRRPRTILVTSSVPNDGKSLTSANLAITLAGAGTRVLLVDADLRKGSLHHRFGIANGVPGLSDALSRQAPGRNDGSAQRLKKPDRTSVATDNSKLTDAQDPTAAPPRPDWADFVQPTRVGNLFLLARGGATHQSSELFLGALTPRFLDAAAALYDFVVLDSAPVMAADDVTSLAPHVDGVIFVIRAEHTSARVARAALDLLYLRHVRVLGLVLNAVRPTSADYYYYYKYKDYQLSYPAAAPD